MISAIPDGLNFVNFITIIIVEFILFVSILLLTTISIKNYIRKKTIERLYVILFLLVNLIMFFQMVLSKILILVDKLDPNDSEIQKFSLICFTFINIISFLIYSGVFILDEEKVKLFRLIFIFLSLIPFLIYIIDKNIIAEWIYVCSIFILSIIVNGGFMVSSHKYKLTLKDSLSRLTMDLLFFMGLWIIITLAMSVINQILRYSGIILSPLNGLYLLYITLGLIPLFLIYLAFFQPLWLRKSISNREKRKN